MGLNYGTKNIYINKETGDKMEYLMDKCDKTISKVIQTAINSMYDKTIENEDK